MDRDAVLATCGRLPGSTLEHPFGPETAVFKVAGKVFALVSLSAGAGRLSLKVEPELASSLRATYPGVTAGYHLNKRHWNTVLLDGSVPPQELAEWIEDSYALVVAGLSRARRAELAG